MIYIARVSGNSMTPTLRDKQLILGFKKNPKQGDVVVAKLAGREVVKRVRSSKNGYFELRGDNINESVDSREYGKVKRSDVIATVIWPRTNLLV